MFAWPAAVDSPANRSGRVATLGVDRSHPGRTPAPPSELPTAPAGLARRVRPSPAPLLLASAASRPSSPRNALRRAPCVASPDAQPHVPRCKLQVPPPSRPTRGLPPPGVGALAL